ncbi:hypothetical protein QJQ45_027271, partial [Haematococcus lacustris]
ALVVVVVVAQPTAAPVRPSLASRQSPSGIARATARACAAGPSHASRGPKEPWYKVLFHEAPGNEGVYECDACGTKDIRAGKNINHLLAHLSTRKCNFKESEAAKEMAKTDDNVKEFLEKTFGHGFGVLRDVAMRLLSIPATSTSTERVFSTFKHIWSDHRQSMLMGRMWMSSYIYFNRRALKGTRGQTRSSEEERAEFEEWLQHQPNGISKFYDRDVSAALNIRRCAVGPGPRPTELCYWDGRPAMPKPGRPGQEWVYLPDKALLRKWRRKWRR